MLQIKFQPGVFYSSGKRRFIGTTDKWNQMEWIGGKTTSLSAASVVTKAITETSDSVADSA